jgi:hypothetical protein
MCRTIRETSVDTEQDRTPEEEDRTPGIFEGIERVVNDDRFPDITASKVEISFLASGELAWRVFDRGGDQAAEGVSYIQR